MTDNFVMLNLAKVQQLFMKQARKAPVFNPSSSKQIELLMERSLSPKNKNSMIRIATQSSHSTLIVTKEPTKKIKRETFENAEEQQILHSKLLIQKEKKHISYSNLHHIRRAISSQDGYCGLSPALKFGKNYK